MRSSDDEGVLARAARLPDAAARLLDIVEVAAILEQSCRGTGSIGLMVASTPKRIENTASDGREMALFVEGVPEKPVKSAENASTMACRAVFKTA